MNRGMTTGRAILLASLSEKDWQAHVVGVLRDHGWLVYHPYDSRRSAAGYPDLTAVHPERGLLLLVELKTARGRCTADQRRWMKALGGVVSVYNATWRPRDIDEVERVAGGG